jgi:protein TonB
MLLLFLAHLAGSLGSAPPTPPKAIFSRDDYPPEAVRHHWQGKVVADLTISAEGSVTACHIVKSSGYQVLDDATCDLLRRRAKFKSATDPNVKPVESRVQTPPVEWRLPSLNSG